MELRFTDGDEIDVEGRLRKVHLRDAWYGAGEGSLVPCDDEAEADEILNERKGG